MAISKKTVKKTEKKAARPAKKSVVKAAPSKLEKKKISNKKTENAKKAVVRQSIIKTKPPAAKAVGNEIKQAVAKVDSSRKILTAEGWKRIMMRERKNIKK